MDDKEFLGRGWAYPVALDHPSGDVALAEGDALEIVHFVGGGC